MADDGAARGKPAPEVSTVEEARNEVLGLIGEARMLAETELAYWKARARYSAGQAGQSAAFGGLALILVVCTLFALIVGLLMIVAQWCGPVWATLIVTGTFLTLAGICGFLARKHALLLKFQDGGIEGDTKA